MKELIKSQINSMLHYNVTYQDIKTVLDEMIKDQEYRVNNGIYKIDWEGDLLFTGTLSQCRDYVVNRKLNKKRDYKSYGLTTPEQNDLVLCHTIEFSDLFK
jgi:hypothetical protein